MFLKLKYVRFIFCCTIFFGISGCDNNKNISTYTTPKTAYLTQPTWKKPKNWQIAPIAHITQIANFKIDTAIASISMLKGNGGSISANVNRWRNQLNLAPVSPQEIYNENREIGNWILVKLANKQQKNGILGAIHQNNSSTVFVKLYGNSETLNAQAEIFLQFITSIKIGGENE